MSTPVLPLGELCEVLDSQRRPITKRDRTSGNFPYYGATGILDYVADYIFDEKLVLIGEDGAKWGAGESTAFSADGKYWVNNHAHVIRPNRDKVLDQWIIYYLNHIDLSPYISGLTVPKLNQGRLREIPIPLPPLPEQQRIVAILDEAFAGLATATVNAEKTLKNVRELFDSYLNLIFTRKGERWVEKTLGDLADFKNGLNFTKSSKGEKIKIVGVKDFQNNFWVPVEQLESVCIDGALSDAYLLQKDDILTVRSNGNKQLIGRCILAPDVPEKTSHSGFTIRIRVKSSNLKPGYLVHYLKSDAMRRMLIESGDGANISSLNQQALSALPVYFPPVTEQAEIVDRIDAIETETSRLEVSYQQKVDDLAELKQSILQKAFTGELTSPPSIAIKEAAA